ncbi:hypothetical protein Tco_0717505 [Tanacetum coccineum]
MADLAFIQQHNMVAYLEKNDGNANFHQILDFLTSTSINFALTVSPTIYASYIKQFWNIASLKPINSEKQIHANIDGKAVVVSESSLRIDLHLNDKDGTTCLIVNEIFENLALMGYETASDKRTNKDTKLPQTSVPQDLGADEAVHTEGGDSVERAITTVASLDAAQDRNGYRWQSQAPRNHGGTPAQTRSERVLEKPNEPPLSEGHTSGSGKGRMEHQFELTANVPLTPHDSPLPGGYTPGSDEGRLQLQELMTMCTKLSKQVLDLEKEKDAQTFESLDDDLDEEDASKQGRGSDKIKPILCNFTLCLWMLEAEEESTMEFELIKIIKSMLEE